MFSNLTVSLDLGCSLPNSPQCMWSLAGIKIANPILKVESVRSIFIPALSKQGSKSLSKSIMLDGIQWSTALALTTRDWPNRRKKGSAFCTPNIQPSFAQSDLSQGMAGQEPSPSWILLQALLLYSAHRSYLVHSMMLKPLNCGSAWKNLHTQGWTTGWESFEHASNCDIPVHTHGLTLMQMQVIITISTV